MRGESLNQPKAEYSMVFLYLMDNVPIAEAAEIVCSTIEALVRRWERIKRDWGSRTDVSDMPLLLEDIRWHLLKRAHATNPRDWRSLGAFDRYDLHLLGKLSLVFDALLNDSISANGLIFLLNYKRSLTQQYDEMYNAEADRIEHFEEHFELEGSLTDCFISF